MLIRETDFHKKAQPFYLYNFRARWYDSNIGRWLSKDPIGLEGGLNLYVFCGNDPVNFVDPDGSNPYAIAWGDALYEAGNLAASDGPMWYGDAYALGYLAVVGVVIGSEFIWDESADFIHDFITEGGDATVAAINVLNRSKGGK